MKITYFEKKKIISLAKKEFESYLSPLNCHICEKMLKHKYNNDKSYCKVNFHCYYTSKYRGAAYRMYKLKYSIPKEISVVFHNESNYDYHYHKRTSVESFQFQ